MQSIGRWKVTGYQIPVFLRGANGSVLEARPDDFILADADGVILIPHALVETVLIEAERLTASEVNIRAELMKGLTLAEALAKFGHV